MSFAPSGQPLTVITVNGNHFASGLTWHPLSKIHNYMDEARKIGKDANMAMVAIRKRDAIIQAGFAPKSNQKLRGVYSLAAALSGTLGDNWIGIFDLGDDRFAFMAVHNGLVMVGRDMVADRETVEVEFNDVFNLLSNESTTEKWTDTGRIVAPEDWDFAHDHSTLEQLLNPKQLRNEHRLRPLRFNLTGREIVLIGVTIAVLLGCAYGFLAWQKNKQARLTAEATAARLALEEELKRKAVASIVKPWESQPQVAAFLTACADHWRDSPLSVGGWIFKAGTCSATGAAATYSRPENGTTMTEFANATAAAGLPVPQVFDVGATGLLVKVLRFDTKPAEDLPDHTATLQALTATVQQTAEAALTTLTLTEKPWEAPPENPQAVAPDWKTTTFVVQTQLNPEVLFASIPHAGIRIREVNAALNPDAAEITWTITGEIYAR